MDQKAKGSVLVDGSVLGAADRWQLDRIRGLHHVLKHESRLGCIVVPHPKKDLGVGLVAAIRKQAVL